MFLKANILGYEFLSATKNHKGPMYLKISTERTSVHFL